MNYNNIFNECGCVKIPKENDFTEFLSDLASEIKEVLPDYDSGKLPSGPYTLLDTALQHRLDAFHLLPEQIVHDNPLYGKRIIIRAHDFSKKMIPLLEHPHILEHVSAILGTSDILLLNGSVHASYPGSSENDGMYHSDTANFSNAKKALHCVSENTFVLNVQIFLDDIDDKLAPMKMLSGTHKPECHLAINSLVSQRLGLPASQENLVQTNWVYDELIEDFNLTPSYLTGVRGEISLMSSSLLHGATKNVTKDRVRRVAILNYIKKDDHFFKRSYPLKESRTFYGKIENPSPLYDIYKKASQASPHIAARLITISSKVRKFVSRTFRRITNPYYSIMRAKRLLEKNVNRIRKPQREYLNIGAGPAWLHERFVVLDQCFKSDESLGRRNFDLVKDLPFPYSENSFKGIYSSHCFEHLTEKEVTAILGESYRTLRIGGTLRVVVPDIEKMFDAYDRRDASYAEWFRLKQSQPGQNWVKDSWLRLLTRQFAGHVVDLFDDKQLYKMYSENSRDDFVTKILLRADSCPSYRHVPNAHKSYWTPDRLVSKFQELGFRNCAHTIKGITRDKVFSNGMVFDNTLPVNSIIVEGTK